MIGLITSIPLPAASASCAADQSNHSASSVKTSRMTLLSTSVALTSASGELHDLVGGDAAGSTAAHVIDERPAAVVAPRNGGLFHPDGITIELEFHLGVRQQPERLTDGERNRDLSFAGHPHGNTPTCKSI